MLSKRSVLLAVVACFALPSPVCARVTVEDSVAVNARPETIWKALMDYQREEKTFHKKVVSSTKDSVSIKEEFVKLPVVGTTNIDYVEVSHRDENRIEYKLTDSKILTLFEGAWIIEENKDGRGSTLRVVTSIDTWVPAPFKNTLLKNQTKKGMEKRLAFVKKSAEQMTTN